MSHIRCLFLQMHLHNKKPCREQAIQRCETVSLNADVAVPFVESVSFRGSQVSNDPNGGSWPDSLIIGFAPGKQKILQGKVRIQLTPSRVRSTNPLPSSPMTSLRTYPLHSQATAWLRCTDMSLRIGKPGFGFGVQVTHTRPSSANEDLTKEASR